MVNPFNAKWPDDVRWEVIQRTRDTYEFRIQLIDFHFFYSVAMAITLLQFVKISDQEFVDHLVSCARQQCHKR